jgi:hypothetical protein
MDFLNHREGGMGLHQVFLPFLLQCIATNSRNCRRLREFEEIEISKQVPVNSKDENSSDFCLDFVQEFGLS